MRCRGRLDTIADKHEAGGPESSHRDTIEICFASANKEDLARRYEPFSDEFVLQRIP